MKRSRRLLGSTGEHGSVAPIVAFGLLAFIGFLALGIDLGQLYVVQNELQNVADGAALAAAKALVQDKDDDGVAEVYCSEAINTAITIANMNRSLGASDPIKITAADVTIGKWDLSAKVFTSQGCSSNPMNVNAVQVRVRRTGEDNPQVNTFLGGVLGVGSQKDVNASAVAFLGLAGTSSVDLPIAVPPGWASGAGPVDSPPVTALRRLLEKFGPAPAYAALPQTYCFYDYGGAKSSGNLDITRATYVLAEESETESNALGNLKKYLGQTRFPQKEVGDKLYPISEWKWGYNIKGVFQLLKAKWISNRDPATGKWRVTLPVYSVTPVTAALPQDSWFKLASRLLPGVSQAYACAVFDNPTVYNQGFVSVDITDVSVKSNCKTYGDQSASDSCRNNCYATIEPVDQSTVSTDKGSNPIPHQKNYNDMNPAASGVGVFAATPRLVK